MRAWCAMLVIAALTLGLGGCSRGGPGAEPGPALRSVAEDEGGGFRLSVSADRDSLRTVDRLAVEIETLRPAGAAWAVTEPDWESEAWGGWTVIDRAESASAADADGRIVSRLVVTLEPFLDGAYKIPPVEASSGERSVATGSMEVRVGSVLEEGDGGELAGSLPARTPGDEPGTPAVLVVSAAGVVALVALLVAWRVGRGRGVAAPAEESALGSLRAVAEGRFGGADALGAVHRAIEKMGGSAAMRGLAARCERARFSPGGGDDARAIARAALEAAGEGGTGGGS